MSTWGIKQEETEMEEQEKHRERLCEGKPFCAYCLDEWEEANHAELDKRGYYDWEGKWTT